LEVFEVEICKRTVVEEGGLLVEIDGLRVQNDGFVVILIGHGLVSQLLEELQEISGTFSFSAYSGFDVILSFLVAIWTAQIIKLIEFYNKTTKFILLSLEFVTQNGKILIIVAIQSYLCKMLNNLN